LKRKIIKNRIKFMIKKNIDEFYKSKHREQIACHQDYFARTAKKCAKCPRENMLSVDHIIPLRILASFGFNVKLFYDEENLQILCGACNHLKSDYLDFGNPKTKKLLIKYLEYV